MYSKYFKIFFVLIILVVLESCGILFPRTNEPVAKVCFFDPVLRSVIYKKKNGKGIKRIEIELVSAEKSTTYLKKKLYASNTMFRFIFDGYVAFNAKHVTNKDMG